MHWKSEYSIGIGVIDRQHEAIFEHMLAVENSLAKQDPWHIVHFLIRELELYMSFHFAVEEALLQLIGYPELGGHQASHARLIEAIANLEEKIKDSGSTASLVEFFEDWFVSHVLSSDRSYVKYVTERLGRLAGE